MTKNEPMRRRELSKRWRVAADRLDYISPGFGRAVVSVAVRAGLRAKNIAAFDFTGPEPALLFGGYARGESFARVTSAGVERHRPRAAA